MFSPVSTRPAQDRGCLAPLVSIYMKVKRNLRANLRGLNRGGWCVFIELDFHFSIVLLLVRDDLKHSGSERRRGDEIIIRQVQSSMLRIAPGCSG